MTGAMRWLDQTLDSPAENLACDEALLELCEAGKGPELLRFWESSTPFVVLGYSNRLDTEVDFEACRRDKIPVLRRCSGGGTVLQGPGCLNYSLILRIEGCSSLRGITAANRYILTRHQSALRRIWDQRVELAGCTDLSVEGRKFSGNSQRRRRRCLLFHGTFLYAFTLSQVEKYLRRPSREPDYRQGRLHHEFLVNLPLSAARIKAALREEWKTGEAWDALPTDTIDQLMAGRYGRERWNLGEGRE